MTDTDLDDDLDRRMEEAYRDLREPLLRLAFLLCGDRDDAEDAVQTAFTAAHPRWIDIDDVGAYLRRTVVNQALHNPGCSRGLNPPDSSRLLAM